MAQSEHEKRPPTSWWRKLLNALFVGSVAGAIEVLIDHPLWTAKTRVQTGQAFTINPKNLYRGILPNASSMIPITAIQVALNQLFQSFFQYKNFELTEPWKLVGGFLAGAGSAFVSGPTEMLMTYQGQHKTSFSSAAKFLAREKGWRVGFFTGLLPTMMRDGGFTVAYLTLPPLLRDRMAPCVSDPRWALLLSATAAGIVGTIVTHPFDSIKTAQQASTGKESLKFSDATHDLYKDGRFFKGVVWRGTRVVFAVNILSAATTELSTRLSVG